MGRQFIREGPMTVLHGHDQYMDHYVFLFNDLFLITKQRIGGLFQNEGYEFKAKAQLNESKIVNVAGTDSKISKFRNFVII